MAYSSADGRSTQCAHHADAVTLKTGNNTG
jgi:hypothetical protein